MRIWLPLEWCALGILAVGAMRWTQWLYENGLSCGRNNTYSLLFSWQRWCHARSQTLVSVDQHFLNISLINLLIAFWWEMWVKPSRHGTKWLERPPGRIFPTCLAFLSACLKGRAAGNFCARHHCNVVVESNGVLAPYWDCHIDLGSFIVLPRQISIPALPAALKKLPALARQHM